MLVGFGHNIITPQKGKIPIAGSLKVRYVDIVHDDIFATAMYCETKDTRIIIVSLDICHPTKELSKDIFLETKKVIEDLKENELIICGTHATGYCSLSEKEPLYTGVGEDPSKGNSMAEMRRYISVNVADAVRKAVNEKRECTLNFSIGEILTGYCRRMVYKDKSVVMYGNPFRPDFLRQEYPDGGPGNYLYFYDKESCELLGIFALAPCPAQADESSSHITGDYWGVVRKKLSTHYGKEIKILTVCSAAGELSPHRVMKSEGRNSIDESGVESSERLGNIVADNIVYMEDKFIKSFTGDFDLKTCYKIVNFPVRKPNKAEISKTNDYFNNYDKNINDDSIRIDDRVLYEYVKKCLEQNLKYYKAPVFGVKIGEIMFFTAPCELFTEYSKRIVMGFPHNPVISMQLVNDCMGYLPTKEAIKGGGYSTHIFSALVSPAGGEKYVKTMLSLLNELKD